MLIFSISLGQDIFLMIMKGYRVIYISVYIVMVLLSCSSHSESGLSTAAIDQLETKEVNESQLDLKPREGLVYDQGELFTGTAVSFYDNGTKAQSVDYVNGLKDGKKLMWFENGDISFESLYIGGKQNGVTKSWWRNGHLRSLSNFENGVPEGVQTQWYKSGAIFKKSILTNGKEEGLQQSWRENGKLYNNYEVKNGKIYGLRRSKLCFKLEDEIVQVESN